MLLKIDYSSDIPIYSQIYNEIIMAISSGGIKPGDKLPTIRVLADQFGINMMTVSKAYQQLKAEGYIQTNKRSGAVVSNGNGGKHLENEVLRQLCLIAAQAKLAGFGQEEFTELCRDIYGEVSR